ncbi:MAG: oligoendopeptidase F family protein, partial [Deltaproteobacteria bacterium]|nr:oligoendopeptidase F family protein [Deltaproteobacteria bacterium]
MIELEHLLEKAMLPAAPSKVGNVGDHMARDGRLRRQAVVYSWRGSSRPGRRRQLHLRQGGSVSIRSKLTRSLSMATSMVWLAACAHPGQRPAAGQGQEGASMAATAAAVAPAAAGESAAGSAPVAAGKVEVAERGSRDPLFQWKIADLYPDLPAWRVEKEAVQQRFAELQALRGKLDQDAQLKRCLELRFAVAKTLLRLDSYANRLADQDTRVAANAALKGETQQLLSDFDKVSAFVEPELLALPEKKLLALAAGEKLAPYRHYLDEVARRRPHTLGRSEEELLAQAGLLGRAPENVYDIFTGSDLKFGKMIDAEGREVEISIPMYIRYRSSSNRADREKIFDGFWKVYREYQNTFATLYGSQINRDLFFARARKYESSLQAALDGENIPPEVYTTMIAAVNEHLPLLHRYLAIRKKLLGVDTLYYHDMYPPLLPSVEMKYSYVQGIQEVADALQPLGDAYVAQAKLGMAPGSGWVDVFPNKGKRTGAYMSGEAYDVHPYVLLNYDESYDDVSTLAHEMGHAMHSHLTNGTQPFQYAGYATFIAEIASTFN